MGVERSWSIGRDPEEGAAGVLATWDSCSTPCGTSQRLCCRESTALAEDPSLASSTHMRQLRDLSPGHLRASKVKGLPIPAPNVTRSFPKESPF